MHYKQLETIIIKHYKQKLWGRRVRESAPLTAHTSKVRTKQLVRQIYGAGVQEQMKPTANDSKQWQVILICGDMTIEWEGGRNCDGLC